MYKKIGSKLYIIIIVLIIANIFAYKNLSEKKSQFEKTIKEVEISERNGDIDDAIRILETRGYKNKISEDKLNFLRYKLLDEYIGDNNYENQIILANKLIQNNPSDEKLKNILQKAKSSIEEQEKAKKEEQERIEKENKAKEEISIKYKKILSSHTITDSRNMGSYDIEVYENSTKDKSFYVVTKDTSGNIIKIFNPSYPNTYKRGEGDLLEINIAKFNRESSQYYLIIGVKDKNYYSSDFNQSNTSKRKYYFYKLNRDNLFPIELDIEQPFYAKNEDVQDGVRVMTSSAWSEPQYFDDEIYIKATSGPSNKKMDFISEDGDYFKLIYDFIVYSEDHMYNVVMYGEYRFENERFKIDTFSANMSIM